MLGQQLPSLALYRNYIFWSVEEIPNFCYIYPSEDCRYINWYTYCNTNWSLHPPPKKEPLRKPAPHSRRPLSLHVDSQAAQPAEVLRSFLGIPWSTTECAKDATQWYSDPVRICQNHRSFPTPHPKKTPKPKISRVKFLVHQNLQNITPQKLFPSSHRWKTYLGTLFNTINAS